MAKPPPAAASLAAILREAGVPEAHIPQRLRSRRIAVSLPAAHFSMPYLRENADEAFQMALTRLVILGRLRVQDDDDGLIFYEPLHPQGRALFIELVGPLDCGPATDVGSRRGQP